LLASALADVGKSSVERVVRSGSGREKQELPEATVPQRQFIQIDGYRNIRGLKSYTAKSRIHQQFNRQGCPVD
jgi:hypothetical protein